MGGGNPAGGKSDGKSGRLEHAAHVKASLAVDIAIRRRSYDTFVTYI
jgi:hypothetical protein